MYRSNKYVKVYKAHVHIPVPWLPHWMSCRNCPVGRCVLRMVLPANHPSVIMISVVVQIGIVREVKIAWTFQPSGRIIVVIFLWIGWRKLRSDSDLKPVCDPLQKKIDNILNPRRQMRYSKNRIGSEIMRLRFPFSSVLICRSTKLSEWNNFPDNSPTIINYYLKKFEHVLPCI